MRFYRITFVGGLAIGYVLGAQAGRERYEQLKRLARKATESPAMQQTAGALQAQASATARMAKQQAAATARSARKQATATAKSAREQAAARMKSARTSAAGSMRKNSTRLGQRRAEPSRARSTEPSVSGNGAIPRPGSDDSRPFVPVNGSLGDHDIMQS
jgi:hypothetical protein